MFATRVLTSVFEFFLTVSLSVLVVFFNYRLFQHANPDYDHEEELRKGNMAVAILLAALLFASGMMVQKGVYPVVTLFRLWMTSPLDAGLTKFQILAYGVTHIVMSFVITVLTMSFSLRFYGRLTRSLREGEELKKGNAAVGVMLGAFVLVVGMYVSEGLGSLSKSLIPQPNIGRVRVMK
jgi:uncharacterized membrane protein YjfL (UPF0719 family)